MKAHAIPCPHQLPIWGNKSVSVAQGGTATPGATKQLSPPDRVLKELYIYIYTTGQSIAETTLDVHLHSVRVCSFCLKKKTRLLSAVDVITRLQ